MSTYQYVLSGCMRRLRYSELALTAVSAADDAAPEHAAPEAELARPLAELGDEAAAP